MMPQQLLLVHILAILATSTCLSSPDPYEIEYVSTPTGLPCKLDDVGITYDGTINVAETKEPCLPWSDATNYTSTLEDANYTVSDMQDYCRAPIINGTAAMPDGPWCFTESGPQYCTIPPCSVAQLASTRQCLKDSGFMSYAGNYTIPDQCLPWTDNAVHLKGFQLWMFPGSKSWIDMQDYCRNPDNDYAPWCYNRTSLRTDGVLEKLYCGNSIPACSLTCRLTEHSLEYVGDATMTEFMNDCLRAQDMIPSIYSTYEEKKRWFEERYVNDDYDIDLYACRSYPAQYQLGVNEQGPVCYVNNTETGLSMEQACSIHFCRNENMDYDWFLTTHGPFGDPGPMYEYDRNNTVEVNKAWSVLSETVPAAVVQESPRSLVIGMCVWGVTLIFLVFLMFLDCSSMKHCSNNCCNKSDDKQGSRQMGSIISFRNNQVQPSDSMSVDDETEGFVNSSKYNKKKTVR